MSNEMTPRETMAEAVRLLRDAADELHESHNAPGETTFDGEPEAQAAYEEHERVANALESAIAALSAAPAAPAPGGWQSALPLEVRSSNGYDAAWAAGFNEGVSQCRENLKRLAAAPAPVAGEAVAVPVCTNCGSESATWQACMRNNSNVVDGRLRAHDVSCVFALGCDDCSETIRVIGADHAASMLPVPFAQDRAAQAGAAAGVPDGWRLVPVDPTFEMQQAGLRYVMRQHQTRDVYGSMLAAAPALHAALRTGGGE